MHYWVVQYHSPLTGQQLQAPAASVSGILYSQDIGLTQAQESLFLNIGGGKTYSKFELGPLYGHLNTVPGSCNGTVKVPQ